jgi:L-asparaginase
MWMNRILIIYTGGTIGMIQDPRTGALEAFNFNHIIDVVPELSKFSFTIDTQSFEKPIDSSNADPLFWIDLAKIIREKYDEYNGFVILHGTDTMAYTASALSFILKGLNKPVILTGSQVPIGMIRTDGKENIITAIEIAANNKGGVPIVSEVAIYFENELHRGNRTVKLNAAHFNAFGSPNYPDLAKAGIFIQYDNAALRPYKAGKLKLQCDFCNDIAVIKLFPGLKREVFQAMIEIKGLKGIVLETFGSGNTPQFDWFIEGLEECTEKGIIILNVTQCLEGYVIQGRYSTSVELNRLGVVSGLDLTTEAAIVKLMMVLALDGDMESKKRALIESWAGELTVSSVYY